MDKKRIAVVGFGGRGQLFAEYAVNSDKAILSAAVDVNPESRAAAKEKFNLSEKDVYSGADEFFAQGKIADAVFICTQDSQHRDHAIKALELGYDVCLEKPAATTLADCEAILAAEKRAGKKVMICHVLRYSHFYMEIKKIIDSGELGDIVTVSQTENVAYWHDAHSYVRGAWRRKETSSPMILAKCCHDLDIIFWLLGKKCVSVSSYGDLYYFKKENAPKGCADYCVDCAESTRKNCPYDAFKIYNDVYKAYNPILGNAMGIRTGRKELIEKLLTEKPNLYGRCVFNCDNDVVDHQVVNILFEKGVTAQLTMTAFSKECHRCIKVHGTLGEIEADMEENKIIVRPFLGSDKVIDLSKIYDDFSVHGGGDKLLFDDFIDYITDGKPSATRTTLEDSIISHKMSFAAEESRLKLGAPVTI